MPGKLWVMPVYGKEDIIESKMSQIELMNPDCDILFIDDGSDDDTSAKIKTGNGISLITHAESLGYGGCLQSAINFAASDYSSLITTDISNANFREAAEELFRLSDDYGISSLSRFIPAKADPDYAVFDLSNAVTDKLNSVTGFSLTDPFSPFKAFQTSVFEKMTLEEFDEAFLIQMWIQSAHFKMTHKEVFFDKIARSNITDSMQLEDETGRYLDFIEGEILLYPL